MEEDLVAFREEIDAITGRMNYLEQSAAMATLTITLIPDALAQPIRPTLSANVPYPASPPE